MDSIKKNALNIINGKPSEIPWIPRWDLMYNSMKLDGTLPDSFKNISYYDATRKLDIGIASTRNKAYKENLQKVEVVENKEGFESNTIFRTPYGELTTTYKTTAELHSHGVRGILVDFAVKRKEDIDAACYIIENTQVVSLNESVSKELEEVGEDGLVVAQAGYLPFHDIMRNWVGYEKFYYLYHDYPEHIKKLLDVLNEKFLKIEKIILECPAEIITIDGHFNTALIPPYIYKEHLLDKLQELSKKLHQRGKFMCSHTDAEMKGMLDLYVESGFDIAESYTPPPMTNTSVSEAFKVWNGKVSLWGGIASVMFSSQTSDADFEKHLYDLGDNVGKEKFIAGIGDNAPTDGVFERLIKVRDFFGGKIK